MGGALASKGSGALYVHVDDIGALTGCSSWSDAIAVALAHRFSAMGFVVKVTLCSELKRFIGLSPSARPAGWEPAPDKLAILDEALSDLQALRYVRRKDLEIVMGHYTHFGMRWRSSFAVAQCVYQLLKSTEEVVKLWPSVQAELRAMRNILPLLYCDNGRRVVPVVLAQDAARAVGARKVGRGVACGGRGDCCGGGTCGGG